MGFMGLNCAVGVFKRNALKGLCACDTAPPDPRYRHSVSTHSLRSPDAHQCSELPAVPQTSACDPRVDSGFAGLSGRHGIMFLHLAAQAASPGVSQRPVLSRPAGSLRELPNLLSDTSIHEGTFRLWGFATKTRLQLTFLSRRLRPPSVIVGTMAGSWANHFPLSLGFPLVRAGMHALCRHPGL